MTHPTSTKALSLRDGGFASAPTPQTPESLAAHLDCTDVTLPAPAEGQVVIEVILAPVNPSDLFFIQGGYGQPRVQGQAAGFEGVGRVISGNGKAAEALIGQRVSFLGTGSGTWAQYAISDAALCIPLHDAVADADAAALIVNPLTAVALVERVKEAGSTSFIVNAAGSQLGRLILGLARDEGLAAIAVIRRSGVEDELRDLGAAEVITAADADAAAQTSAALKAHKPRVLLDAVGDQSTADLFFAMPSGARWISYGKMSDEAPRLTQMGQFIFMDKHIEGFWLSRWLPSAPPERRASVITKVQERFASGKWSTRVAAEVPLDQALDKVLPLLAQGAGKVLIKP
ncbi:alcohol dehydrogenase catalytic domain-containing protein [Pararhodobacter oceanensis]|uniref:enoyl-[acyl-carrier-protein] reductase n=1 Tax=Pararhodobacter oceanensis TaxID=2172121 RepID=A0A2T8HYW4_9RHOB|nr:alcohol dehydrogenase catalytic domain-containing protein [Pararhodobacter oceanensis]PVH30625.1 zinc-binding dehydrogenase [Pararhodobacter oceanensis]